MTGKNKRPVVWMSTKDALAAFASGREKTQSSAHINPLHWNIACRLVIEGGFHPDEVTPHPPLVVDAERRLVFDEKYGDSSEMTLLGGLRTKDVDVVVIKPNIGPVIAISAKGMLSAYRNLTNRMEEAVGDCVNLHTTYPGLVYGFIHILRGTKPGPCDDSVSHFLKPDAKTGRIRAADVAIDETVQPSDAIIRYHNVLVRFTGRRDIRNDISRYESSAMAIVLCEGDLLGEISRSYPAADSPITIDGFFERIYRLYDIRYVYAAPELETQTRRLIWNPKSPVFSDPRIDVYQPRIDSAD